MPSRAENKDGLTPLMGAAAIGHTDLAVALLRAGAAKDTRDNLGWTAYEAATYNNHAATAEAIERARTG